MVTPLNPYLSREVTWENNPFTKNLNSKLRSAYGTTGTILMSMLDEYYWKKHKHSYLPYLEVIYAQKGNRKPRSYKKIQRIKMIEEVMKVLTKNQIKDTGAVMGHIDRFNMHHSPLVSRPASIAKVTSGV